MATLMLQAGKAIESAADTDFQSVILGHKDYRIPGLPLHTTGARKWQTDVVAPMHSVIGLADEENENFESVCQMHSI
jgi:hypothetical protein